MDAKSKSALRAALLLFGTVVGAGVYALPAMFKLTGILAGSVVFWFLALVVLATHLLYAGTSLRRGEIRKHKFPGQVALILGPWAGRLALIVHPLLLIGVCFAYLLLAGDFLSALSRHFGGPETVISWQLLFWAAGAAVVFFGLKIVARVESWLTSAVIASFVLAIFLFASKAHAPLFATADWSMAFIPFGTFLFSLSAYSVVPDVIELCGRDRKRSLRAITIGSLGAALLIWLYGVLGYAAIGASLTMDPSDAARAFAPSFFWLLPTVGFLSVATAFIALMQDLREVLHAEFPLSNTAAWILALGSPLVLLLLTERNFLATVGFIGGIFNAIIGLLICFMAMETLAPRSSFAARLVPLVCSVVFILGLIWRILPV